MGTFYHPIQIFSPDGDSSEEIDALVDTGASFSQIPAATLRRLGIFPTGTAQAELADGRVVDDAIDEAKIRIQGRDTYTWITFGPEGAAPLLGAHALGGVRLAVDPSGRRLIPARILRIYRKSE